MPHLDCISWVLLIIETRVFYLHARNHLHNDIKHLQTPIFTCSILNSFSSRPIRKSPLVRNNDLTCESRLRFLISWCFAACIIQLIFVPDCCIPGHMSPSLSRLQYTHSFCTGVILIDPDLRIHYNSLPLDLTHDLLKGRLNIIISQSFKFN